MMRRRTIAGKKKAEKILWKKRAKKAGALFLLYGFLPLLCGLMAGSLLWLNAFGAEAAEEILAHYGEDSAVAALYTPQEEGETEIEALTAESEEPPEPEPEEPAAPQEPPAPSVIYNAVPEDAVPVIACDLSAKSYFINTTKYTIDVDGARNAAWPVAPRETGDAPVVLVLHTHATESYLFDDTNLSDFAGDGVETYFPTGTSLRNNDPARTVVQVGEVFCQALRDAGIPTIHCTDMHDLPDFNQAYGNSAQTVRRYLEEYPSIRYVIDLHRDSVTRGDAYVKTSAKTGSDPCAQVMLVVGTNQNGRHPNWLQNLSVAVAFKDQMDREAPGLSRALYLRTARFNQEFLPGCMLLEVGSAMNTLEEAERAARTAGEQLAKVILSHE